MSWAGFLLVAALSAPPNLGARVAFVQDLDSGEVLLSHRGDEVHAIASISKLMALRTIVMNGLAWDGTTTMVSSDKMLTKGGARSRLIEGRAYRNIDLVHAALLGSDNRAVLALGRSVGLDANALAAAMTANGRALGLGRTSFLDPTGINHGNRSTAREIVQILKAVLGTPILGKIPSVATWKTAAKERSGIPLAYRNTNALVHHKTRLVLAGKTGFNSAAGWCVATAIQLPSGRTVAIIVLGTDTKYTRFRDSYRLEKWVKGLPWERPNSPTNDAGVQSEAVPAP